ncbi:MAG TPA: hypothetical protein VE869_13780 [Gemmatimonas sp.]|nr:hypothetical protein [Gemmatimonas sp.]
MRIDAPDDEDDHFGAFDYDDVQETTFPERLAALVAAEGGKARFLARMVEPTDGRRLLELGLLNKWLNPAKTAEPSFKHLRNIAERFDVSLTWLVAGQGQMRARRTRDDSALEADLGALLRQRVGDPGNLLLDQNIGASAIDYVERQLMQELKVRDQKNRAIETASQYATYAADAISASETKDSRLAVAPEAIGRLIDFAKELLDSNLPIIAGTVARRWEGTPMERLAESEPAPKRVQSGSRPRKRRRK